MPELARTGRPRVWCSDTCRWRAGHDAARARRPPPAAFDDPAWLAGGLADWLATLPGVPDLTG